MLDVVEHKLIVPEPPRVASSDETWAGGGWRTAKPSKRITCVIGTSHAFNLPKFAVGKRQPQDATSDATFIREHLEETGIPIPPRSVTWDEASYRKNAVVPHWLLLHRAADIRDDELDHLLMGRICDEVMNLERAKTLDREHEWRGLVDGREEETYLMTAEQIIVSTEEQFVSLHRGMALDELKRIANE